MSHVLIVGGGISGLASAWFLRQRGHVVTILEAAGDVGGCIRTVRVGPYLVDEGPTSTLVRNGALSELISEIDFANEPIEANPASRRRYIVRDDKLHPLPTGPVSFFSTPLFLSGGKLRLLLEPFIARADAEESIAQFVRRRLGPEFLDWAVDPFVSGVYAGDPARLSIRAATPKIYALEGRHRSLFLGALSSWLHGRYSGPAPAGRLISFVNGMQVLPRRLRDQLGDAVHTRTETHEIEPLRNRGWIIRSGEKEFLADRVVLAVPAHRAANLLAPLNKDLAQALREIYYAPVASIALGFSRNDITHTLDGFGVLIPSRLRHETLGALFSSTLFPSRAPPDHVLLTAFIGGARNPRIIDHTPSTLLARVLDDLHPLLGIRGMPEFTRVSLWHHAIPQYELGHLDRVRRIDALAARFPNLYFRSSWRDGISVSDCVLNARTLAETIAPA